MNPINQEKISKLKKRKKTWIQKLRDWICLSFNVVTVILGSLPHKSTFTRKKEGKIRARNRRQRQRRGPLFFSEGSLSHRSQRARAFIQVWIAEVVWFRCFFGVPIIIGFTQYFEVTRTHTQHKCLATTQQPPNFIFCVSEKCIKIWWSQLTRFRSQKNFQSQWVRMKPLKLFGWFVFEFYKS